MPPAGKPVLYICCDVAAYGLKVVPCWMCGRTDTAQSNPDDGHEYSSYKRWRTFSGTAVQFIAGTSTHP